MLMSCIFSFMRCILGLGVMLLLTQVQAKNIGHAASAKITLSATANHKAGVYKEIAAKKIIKMYTTASKRDYIGSIIAANSKRGLLLHIDLSHVTPGWHGLHVHQYPSCANHGSKAGEHLDPAHTKKHRGPYAHGHLGDLPRVYANSKQVAHEVLLAPRLQLSQIIGHSVILHAGGDNYSDLPKANGGGGARFACGIVHH